MKTVFKFVTITFLAAACCASLNFSVARADDDEQGGDIEGTENLEVDIMMTPTAAAPPGSSIELKLEAKDDEGQTEAELELHERGLPAGTFSVSVTLKSNGSTVQLGNFTVANGQNDLEIKFSNEAENENENDGGEIELPFPANFNPFDIATVSVSDSNGVVLFTANLSNATASTMTLVANVTGKPGPSDPNATGAAMLNATASSRGPNGSVQLMGQGMPPRVPLTTVVNDSTVRRKAKTDNNGNFNFNFGPKGKTSTVAPGVNLFQIKSITLKDSVGNVLMTFSF